MKLQKGRFTGKEKEANLIEAAMDGLFKKYGFDMVRHVSNKMFENVRKTRNLEKEIAKRERELGELRRKAK